SYLYYVVLPDLDPRFPIAGDIEEAADVVGYFLKFHAYLDGANKGRRAVLLLGRLLWEPSVPPPPPSPVPFVVTAIVGGLVLAALLLRWALGPGRRLLTAPNPLPTIDRDEPAPRR